MKQNLLFNQASALGKRLAMVLTMLLIVGVGSVWGADATATLSFADKAQRTSFSTTQQVWEQNGVTFTNDKASSSNSVADYAAPVRLYANSSVTVACSLGNMTKIVFDCNSSSYVTAMKNSIGSSATASSDKVTVTLDGTSNTFTISKLTAQIRLDALTVTYEEEVTCTEINPSLTYTPSTLEIGSTATPSLTGNTGNGTVTYSSDNTDVATVDATTGVVTAIAAGTATITATIDANGEYCAGVATATIKVNKQSATIVLSEAGTENTVSGTFYKDDSYTLPSSTDAKCGDKVLVGWSTIEIAETDTKPTSNYYDKGTSVSLKAGENKFYAVFATESKATGGTTTTPATATLSFASTAQRTTLTTSQQVWTQNEITLTNDKGSSTSNVADYSNPARFYKSSKITLSFTYAMTQIVFTCSSSEYATNLKNSITSGAAVTTSSSTVTAELTEPATSFVISSLSGQVRMNSLEVTYNKTTTGGTTITYSDYTTQCTTETVVTLNPNGGTIEDSKWTFENDVYKLTTEDESITLPAITRTGYTFAGWATSTNGSVVYEDKAKIEDLDGTPITLFAQWNCTSPTAVGIEGTYHFFPNETITLTATPTGGSTPTGYQWQKFIEAEWKNIDGAITDTYTKGSATTSDVGQYRCIVYTGTDCSETSAAFNVKCLQLYVYWDNKSDKCNQVFTKVDATTATTTVNMENSNYKYYFKITDGCGNWYGLDGDIHSGWCTNVSLNANEHCGLQTTKLGAYVFNVDYSDLANLKVSVIYPSGNQEAGKVIYWDNNVLNWTYSDDAEGKNKIYYRIGRSNHNTKQLMQLVPGTANLYQVTTTQYDNFEAWHIANNGCWSDNNSIYKTNTGDDWAATAAMAFEPNAVTANSITVTPTNTHSTGNTGDNNNCEFYTYDIATGMKTWNAKVISATGGTITVSYTHHDGTSVTDFTSGNRDLAHTCLLTITATPNVGYSLASLTVNDKPFTSGNIYTLTADAVIKVTWTAKATPTFAWSATTCTAVLEADNTFPTLSNPNSLSPVTYASSNTGVATIDADGNITLLATGTTTITATGAETATHKSATTTYELTVVESNCRWVETTTIEDGDEIVFIMVDNKNSKSYAMNNSVTSKNPLAEEIEDMNIFASGNVPNEIIWNIHRDENGIVFYSKTALDNHIYCTASYVTVGVKASGKTFTLHNGYIRNLSFGYLAVATGANTPYWQRYDEGSTNLANQTLKLYKRECLDASKVWVEGNLTNVTCDPQLPQQLAKDRSITLTFTAADGYELPNNVTVTNAAKNWDKANGTLTISNPTDNVLVTVEAVELHTITWMVGSNSVLTEEVANATGVTQTPGDDIADNAIGDCANAFMGWTETPLGSTEGQSAPADLCTAAQMKTKHSSVNSDKTFYAVFATKEGGEDYLQISNESDLVAGNKYLIVGNSSSTYRALPVDNASNLTYVYPSSSKISNPADGLIWTLEGTADRWKIKSASNNKYLQITNGNLTFVENTTFTFSVSVSSSKFTFTSSASSGNKVLSYYHKGNCFNAYTTANNVYIYKQDIDYFNYVTNCCALAPATNLTVSGTTAKSATLTWTAPSSTTGINKLQVRNAETDAVVVDNIAVNTTTTTIDGLTECTSYQYYVVSVGDCEVVSNTVTATPFSGAKTVNYDYNGGSGSPASFTTSCENKKIILPNATRPGYTFNGWFDAASGGNLVGVAGAEYNPTTSPITLFAHWTENTYQLIHSGSNYTITENKTSIKSSDTPLALHYTCTGDYGLPATISITSGGKSWTVGTDYTWEVAADKQSATLAINQTTITADVTITINVATRYTVTFVHNDKGVFSGSEAIEVLSSENTITLPTVTDVSCGFYDTFEGWIVADEDYTESTSKPAGTIYKGGANYTVNSDCTLRALYSKCEGDATQVYRKVTSTGEVTDGTYILVANTSTPRVYSGYGGATYGSSVDGLTADGEDFSTTLPVDAKPITVTTGTGTNAGTFAMYNADRTKYLTYTGSSNTLDESDSKVFIWKLTDGLDVNSRSCPAGVLTPNGFDTRVLQCNTSSSNRFACYTNNASFPHVFLYKLIDKCTKYYSTNPSCEKPVGVHIVYNANAVDASMSCSTQDRTYKVENDVNKYPQLASQLQFCTNATREGYTLVGWNTQTNGQGTTYNINQNYYNLPVSGELDGYKWITLNLYAMWKPCIKFNLGNATGGTGVPDAVVENGECVLPEPTAEQLGTIPCGYEFYAWSETSVNATQTKPALLMPGDTYTGSALTLYAVYRLCETGSNADLFSLSYTISGTKYYVGPVLDTRENRSTKFSAVTNENDATVFGMKSVEGQTYKSLFWVDSEGNNKYMYWKDYGASFQFTSEEDDSYGWTVTGTTKLTFVSTPYMTNGSRYLSADATEIGCPSDPKAVTQFTKEMASTMICTYATEPECSTTATLQFVTNGGTLNYPTTYDANSYQNLTPGATVYLPTATFAGEWTFEGWMKDEPLTSQNLKPETVNFIEVELDITTYSASKTGTTTFYAVYSKTNDDKQFDPVNGGTYKLFAIGADGTKTYMPVWTGTRGTPSGVTTCAETGDYTITPGTGTHAGQYQITCGEYTLGVVGDISQTDLNEVEDTWWNINPSTSGKGTWRITVVGSSLRALSCSFSTAKSFGNYVISEVNKPSQTTYRDMEIGECIYTEYTSTPENIPYITITGAPVKITSANGERVYAPTTLHIEAHNFTGERIIHLSATNGFGVDPVQVRTNGQGAYSGDVKVYYEPTADGDGQTFTTSVLSASQTGGTNAEKISQTFAAIQGRNMPANFVIAAKWDGHWYALPANCTSSLSSTEGLLIEVDDVDNPTMATSAPASAKYGIREVIPSRQTNNGKAIVFTERFAEGDKQFALYNGSNANIQVNAQYTNYAQTNPDKYEWIPSTSDFKDYTLTNASTGRNLGLTSGSFGAYTAASNQVRLLPATFYEPAPVQVLKWKANSVIVMYTGAEATATTQVGDNAKSAEQTLANQQLTHGIYELTTNQALTDHAGGELNIYIGTNTRVELEIPLIISGKVTASANAHDVVILENSKLTAAETKYSYKDVYVYGGAKLAIPENTELGVNNIILRAGGVATNGAGRDATYQYIYPQVELKGTLTSAVQNIRYEYVTDYDHWYHLALPFDGSLASIHYPYEYYGDQVKLDNTGSWQIKRYAGEIRATGNYDAWVDIETEGKTSTTAGQGYIFWGAPKKVTANDVYDRPKWGIQRITMSVSAPAAKTAENGNKTIAGLSSHKDVPNKSEKVNDQGWNLIGNPYMVNLTGLNSESLKPGKLVEVEDAAGNWTGQWKDNEDGFRYVTIPSDHFDTYTAQRMTAFTEANPMIAGRAFFIQLEDDDAGVTFSAANRASLLAARVAANEPTTDIETGIVLSNETMQDEVNFWIKAGKTNDYEYNADYPKTPNNNQFNIYGVHTNGDLSWVATGPEYAAESMPIGYQVPAAGTYMLSLSEIYNSDGLDALYVTDHALSPEVTVDIMSEPYEFSVNQAETNNERFTVSVRVKAKTENGATGLGNVGADGEQIHKFIYQDKMYILHHGVIYDATGKRVITINK